tara:strand:+ start:795 stop:1088 length:294 start_codon:yes stop_codon:yes gene_type:complete
MKKLVDTFTPVSGGFGTDLLPPGYGYNKKYKYKVNLYTYGVGFETMAWCWKNCNSAWGWYFIPKPNVEWAEDYENQNAILTFKSKKDFIYYRLSHGG